jgi:hypothetical protein
MTKALLVIVNPVSLPKVVANVIYRVTVYEYVTLEASTVVGR